MTVLAVSSGQCLCEAEPLLLWVLLNRSPASPCSAHPVALWDVSTYTSLPVGFWFTCVIVQAEGTLLLSSEPALTLPSGLFPPVSPAPLWLVPDMHTFIADSNISGTSQLLAFVVQVSMG